MCFGILVVYLLQDVALLLYLCLLKGCVDVSEQFLAEWVFTSVYVVL